jgi:hypothetical protein
MQKTILIPTHLSACQFGITDVDYFVKNIRGKQVTVVNETKGFMTIADAHDEQWTVHKGDLQTNPEKEVA